MPRIELQDVHLTYDGPHPVRALDGIDLRIEQGEFVSVVGPSGGGKSTLLNVLGLLDVPTEGRMLLDGVPTPTDRDAAAQLRSTDIAFIFQSFHLLDRRPVIDSVELGLTYRGVARTERHRLAMESLRAVGLERRALDIAGTLSGGQRQRVAIARALATRSPIVLADEPTGNLDTTNAASVLDALRAVHARGSTVVLVTHDPAVAAQADRQITILDGRCISDATASPQPTPSCPPVVAEVGNTRRRRNERFRDAWANLISRRSRAAALSLAVAIGVGLAVATTGLSSSASSQVSTTFDLRENRFVTAEIDPPEATDVTTHGWTGPSPENAALSVQALAGVQSAAVVSDHDQHSVRSANWRPPVAAKVYSVSGDVVRAANLGVTWAPGSSTLHAGSVLIGTHLADELMIGPLEANPTITVDNVPYTVAGVVTGAGQAPELTSGIVLEDHSTEPIAATVQARVLVQTATGAAQQVAHQLPLVVNPTGSAALTVHSPTDPRDLRASIQADLHTTLLVLSAVALLAAFIGLTNSMALAVMERRQEFGLRRAVGAKSRDISGLVLTESALVGIVGGGAGLALGTASILAVTLAQHWTPVFDIRLAPVALASGLIVGMLSGLLAARRATQIQPSQALRQ